MSSTVNRTRHAHQGVPTSEGTHDTYPLWLTRQASRIRLGLASTYRRHQRRVAASVRDAELQVIDRGRAQPWHRDGQEPT